MDKLLIPLRFQHFPTWFGPGIRPAYHCWATEFAPAIVNPNEEAAYREMLVVGHVTTCILVFN